MMSGVNTQATTQVLRRPVGSRARSVLNQRPHMWRVMCELSRTGPFTIADVRAHLNSASADSVRKYLRELLAAGYVSRQDNRAAGGNVLWQVVRPQAAAPRLRPGGVEAGTSRGQQHMWNAMRRLKSFDFNDLAAIASTDDCVISPGTAQRYIGLLNRAGYLVEVRRPGPRRRGRYRLRCNTGPRAPRIVRALHDPNTGEIIIGEERLQGEELS